jgi:hypothetical protein
MARCRLHRGRPRGGRARDRRNRSDGREGARASPASGDRCRPARHQAEAQPERDRRGAVGAGAGYPARVHHGIRRSGHPGGGRGHRTARLPPEAIQPGGIDDHPRQSRHPRECVEVGRRSGWRLAVAVSVPLHGQESRFRRIRVTAMPTSNARKIPIPTTSSRFATLSAPGGDGPALPSPIPAIKAGRFCASDLIVASQSRKKRGASRRGVQEQAGPDQPIGSEILR